MSDAELIARLRDAKRDWPEFGHDRAEAADRIEALTEQLNAARQDAKEAEAYAEELENEAVLSKAAYEGVSSLLLSVQQDCIKERQRAERLEAKLAKAVEALQWCAMYGDGDVALATLAEIKGESHE